MLGNAIFMNLQALEGACRVSIDVYESLAVSNSLVLLGSIKVTTAVIKKLSPVPGVLFG
jgi:hypothetical protein